MPIDWDEQKRIRAIVKRLDHNRAMEHARDACRKALSKDMARAGVKRITLWSDLSITHNPSTVAVPDGSGGFVDPNDGVPVGGWL